MSEKEDELISAFVDDETTELETHRSIKALLASEVLRQRWERYHLMRDALRGNLSARFDGDFVTKVMAQLETESPVVESAYDSTQLPRTTIGFGVAAALAVIGLVAVVSLRNAPQTFPEAEVAQLGRSPDMSLTVGNRAPPNDQVNPQAQATMDSFLVNHAEYASPVGVMPYARVVGYQIAPR